MKKTAGRGRNHERRWLRWSLWVGGIGLFLVFLFAISSAYAGGSDAPAGIELEFKDTGIRDVLQAIAAVAHVNIVTDSTVDGRVTVKLKGGTVKEALEAVLKVCRCHYRLEGDVYLVSRNRFPESTVISVDSEGRVTVRARDADLREVLMDVSREAGLSVVPSADITGKISIELQGVPISEVVPALVKAGDVSCFEQNGIWFVEPTSPSAGKDSEGRSEPPSPDVPTGSSGSAVGIRAAKPVVTRVIGLKYLKASEALEYLSKASLSGSTSGSGLPPAIRTTKEENILLVTGTEEAIARIQEEIEQIDIPAPQVSLEARIMEIYTGKDKSLGLLLARASEGKFAIDVLQGELSYASGGFTKELNAILQSLVQRGDGKVIASPRICTLAGHEALIDIGEVRYFKVTTYPESGQPGGQPPVYYPYATLQTVSAGIMLKITPWVGATGQITVEIECEVSSVAGITSEGLPEIHRRKANTTIRVRDGDSIAIGGLMQQEDTKSVTKIPVLGDLPILGGLFRNTKVISRQSELLIFITPKILSSNGSTEQERADEAGE